MRFALMVSALLFAACGGTESNAGQKASLDRSRFGSLEADLGTGEAQLTICHIPPGNPANAHTITVGVSALPAHKAHGDFVGPCSSLCVPAGQTCTGSLPCCSPLFCTAGTCG